ncbi:F-box/kelch-repeat protein OR23-like protein [Drosera capensis]
MDGWVEMEELPEPRAGCVGFRVGEEGKEGEVWVVGGYGEERTIGGTVPVDEYCRGVAVLEGGGWRVVEDVWGGGRVRNGKIVVVEDVEGQGVRGVFMLDEDIILRYDMTLNRWLKEAVVPRKAPPGSSVDFITLDEELYVMTFLQGVDASGIRRSRQRNRSNVLHLQIYHPWKKSWRSLVSKPPFQFPSDFRSISLCTVRI